MMFRMFAALMFAATLALSAHAADKILRLAPMDEGSGDASFLNFRNELKAIISRKDAAALMKHVAPNVPTSFGGGWGRPTSKRRGSWATPRAWCGAPYQSSWNTAAISTTKRRSARPMSSARGPMTPIPTSLWPLSYQTPFCVQRLAPMAP